MRQVKNGVPLSVVGNGNDAGKPAGGKQPAIKAQAGSRPAGLPRAPAAHPHGAVRAVRRSWLQGMPLRAGRAVV